MEQSISDGNVFPDKQAVVCATDQRTSVSDSVNNSGVSTNSDNINTMGVRYYTSRRANISVAILCFINLINYMDRYTLAGI